MYGSISKLSYAAHDITGVKLRTRGLLLDTQYMVCEITNTLVVAT